jgi:hypothetical protein
VEPELTPLAGWESFYVIVGTSAAALTGLSFVVIALVAESKMFRDETVIGAFGSPTVVHFCVVLFVSVLLSAPWHLAWAIALCIGLCAAAGLVYVGRVVQLARRQTQYRPVPEDWFWHAVLPSVAYACLLVTSATLSRHLAATLFVVAAVSLLLLYVGIHNAWDAVTWIARQSRNGGE